MRILLDHVGMPLRDVFAEERSLTYRSSSQLSHRVRLGDTHVANIAAILAIIADMQ
jgi:hypothetical protein